MTRSSKLLLLPVLAAGLAGCSQPAETSTTPPPRQSLPVRVAQAEVRDIDETIALTGTLRPRAQVEAVAEVAGRLLRIERDEGAAMAPGDVLAVIDDSDHQLALERAEAALRLAQANHAHAQAEQERAEGLLRSGGITDKDHLAAKVALQVAEASRAQAQVEVSVARQQLDRTRVRAPFAGHVARRLVDPGTMLAHGTPVFVLVADDLLEFRASVPSVHYGRVHTGASATISVDASDDAVAQGRVKRITPLIDERNRSFDVVIEVPRGGALVGGLFARAELRVGRIDGAVVVPPAAVVRGDRGPEQASVFVVDVGRAQRREVHVGREAPDAIQIVDGVIAGDSVILDPPASLTDGVAVAAQR